MLSLTAKLAVLYAQSSRDSTVINAVTELEQISANLSAKVWQKITLIQSREDMNAGGTVAAATQVDPETASG